MEKKAVLITIITLLLGALSQTQHQITNVTTFGPIVPQAQKTKPIASRSTPNTITSQYSSEDLLWLSRIIHAEAKGEPFKGKVAVGAVILNRVEDDKFPNTIHKVIHQSRNGRYQFQPVSNGKIENKPNHDSIEAAKIALEGKDPTNGALYFYNPKISRSIWMAKLNKTARIGNHVFADS